MPLPRSTYGGRWQTVSADGSHWVDDTSRNSDPGYLPVPAPLATTDSDLLKVEGGVVLAKTDADLVADRRPGRLTAIDARTVELIDQGFIHGGKQFSLSLEAQINWTNMGFASGQLPYPYRVATKNDTGYHDFADSAEMQTAYGAALNRKATLLGAGASLKAAILLATTTAELDAVVDTRT